MIVRAVRIRVSPGAPELAEHSALRLGAEYMVLEIESTTEGPASFRVLDEEQDPTMWPSDCFELVDGTIPRSWVAAIWSTGTLYLAPQRWHRPDFWEEFLYGQPGSQAQRLFHEELERMRAEAEE
jgi:hypothetical protein